MTNFLKWIEYLATGHDYCFTSVVIRDKDLIEFDLRFDANWADYIEDCLVLSLKLRNFEPKKLWNWNKMTQEFVYSNDYENSCRPVKQTAQNLLKLIEELKHNGIELKHLMKKIYLIKLYNENIILYFEDNERFEFENGHFKELDQTTEFKKLIYYFKVLKITKEQK